MKAPPDSVQELLDRFDRDRFDMPDGRARLRLTVKGEGTWDLEVDRRGQRLREARSGEPDAVIAADPLTWARSCEDLQTGMAAFRSGRLSIRGNMHLGIGFFAASGADPGEGALRFETIETKLGRVAAVSAGTGRTIVMLHGLGATKFEFMPTLAAMSQKGWRVVAIDLPGFGDSDKPLGASYDAAFFARWVVATLDALEIDRAHVLGHSMGGRVAIEVGMEAPDRTDRLVLMTPSMAWLTQHPLTPLLKLVRPELGFLQPTPKSIYDSVVRRLVPASSNHEIAPVLDEFIRAYSTPRGRVAFYAAARSIALEQSKPFWSRLELLAPESLFIWGRHDTLVPIGFARHVKRALPAARHVELAAGHSPQVEAPRRLHAEIDRFLAGRPAAHGARARARPAASRRTARSA